MILITTLQQKRFKKLLDSTDKMKIAEDSKVSYSYVGMIINRKSYNESIVKKLEKACDKKDKAKKQAA